ncbi:MAG: DUF4382 domain-containing protein [Ignavibacteriae bacterium]|nr:MAG: DUF4382 domain-containing protein [Ignavibacteriota bacterium]
MINYHGMKEGNMNLKRHNPRRQLIVVAWCTFITCVLAGCSSGGANDQGELFIKVLDAPANYQEINIVVDRVSIHRTGSTPDVGWTVVSTTSSGKFNLLHLLNGRNLQLVLNKVAVGTYDQIKLNYGACTIMADDLEQSLQQDSSIQSGNTILYGFQVVEGQQVQLTLDFDAYRSVLKNGELYMFKPHIRVQNTLLSGSIAGSVLDSGRTVVPAAIVTYTGIDTVRTASELPYGSFQLSDLPEGIYSVAVVPESPFLEADTINNIKVVRRLQTNLGAIHLQYRK